MRPRTTPNRSRQFLLIYLLTLNRVPRILRIPAEKLRIPSEKTTTSSCMFSHCPRCSHIFIHFPIISYIFLYFPICSWSVLPFPIFSYSFPTSHMFPTFSSIIPTCFKEPEEWWYKEPGDRGAKWAERTVGCFDVTLRKNTKKTARSRRGKHLDQLYVRGLGAFVFLYHRISPRALRHYHV